MDLNNAQNQSYWFVVREDQSNVYNFTIQNPPIVAPETRYIVDAVDNRHLIHINDPAAAVPLPATQSDDKEVSKSREEDNFWDRNKIKLLLTLCLENRFKNATKDRTLWNEVAALVGAAPDECHKKYRNLRRTYIRLLKKKRIGKHIKWVHYNICEEVFKDCKSLPSSILEPWEDTKVKTLLNLYIENLNRFRDPNVLQKDIWKEIASVLETTEYNCYHKFKNLKRTYFNWLERSRESGKLMKWPYQQYFERIFYNFNPSLGPWDKNKIDRLMHAYTQIAHKFRNPKYLKKELWKEIGSVVGESPSDCDRKFRNLKQTYIRLKMKADTGRSITKWCYYKYFEEIFNHSVFRSSTECGHQNIVYELDEEDYIDKLLSFYIDNKEKFRDPLTKKKNLWKQIGSKLGLSSAECDKKFRNLKQTYIRLREKRMMSGKCVSWPYYSFFAKIYDEHNLLHKDNSNNDSLDHMTLYEARRTLRNMQKRDIDKFEKLVKTAEESNDIQRERNRILQALLDRK